MNLEATRLRGRPRNRWQDEVREDGRLVCGKGWKKRVHKQRGMEDARENGKESSHSAHTNDMNEWISVFYSNQCMLLLGFHDDNYND